MKGVCLEDDPLRLVLTFLAGKCVDLTEEGTVDCYEIFYLLLPLILDFNLAD